MKIVMRSCLSATNIPSARSPLRQFDLNVTIKNATLSLPHTHTLSAHHTCIRIQSRPLCGLRARRKLACDASTSCCLDDLWRTCDVRLRPNKPTTTTTTNTSTPSPPPPARHQMAYHHSGNADSLAGPRVGVAYQNKYTKRNTLSLETRYI